MDGWIGDEMARWGIVTRKNNTRHYIVLRGWSTLGRIEDGTRERERRTAVEDHKLTEEQQQVERAVSKLQTKQREQV